MSVSVKTFAAKRASKVAAGAALALWSGVAIAGAPGAAWADEAERPAVTPLDLSPPSLSPRPPLGAPPRAAPFGLPSAGVDFTPLGALRRPASGPTPLDLSPPSPSAPIPLAPPGAPPRALPFDLPSAASGVDYAPLGALRRPASRPTPLDLSPPGTPARIESIPADAPPEASPSRSTLLIDFTPVAALPRPAPSRVPLDLSPPPGLSFELPPEADAPSRTSYAEAAAGLDSAVAPPIIPPPAPVALTPAAVALPAPRPPDEAPAVAEARPDLPAPAAEPAPETLSPETLSPEAVHSALDAWLAAKPVGRPVGAGDWEAARRAIAAVYAERGYAPLWIEGGAFGAAARAALARLARADEDGLSPPPMAVQTPGAEAEIALSGAVVAYALQASGARIAPRYLTKDVTARPPTADPAAALKAVASAPDADAALAAFNPPHPEYRALRAALAALRGNEAAPVARALSGPALKLGMSDPRVPLIRARFGLGAAPDPAAARIYDVKVVSAVAAFQRVHGLSANGTLTPATAEAMAGGGEGLKARRLIANMEMWRWMPRDLGFTRVEVNLPAFALKVTSGGQVVHRARVIVGKPDTPTPVFSDNIRYLLLNPAWHVPDSIIKKEMAPRLASDPNYLARRGFKVSYAGDKLVVEQPPGEANALGRMLFLFPNEHAVYLHDTPQRQLFGQNFRALSHGCVRVEDPAALAELLMGGARRGWSQAKINALLGDKERTYTLAAPVPVHLEYFTEVADERGSVESLNDVYGLTDKVISALAALRRD